MGQSIETRRASRRTKMTCDAMQMLETTMRDAEGDCFEAAFNHLADVAIDDLDGERFVLVHGNLADLPQLDEVNHAWVEEGEIVHEVSNGQYRRLSKAKYYEHFKVTKTRRYSLAEAMGRGAETKGPWAP